MNFFLSKVKKKIFAFTLMELLVSMTIISIMAALSISSYPKFSEQVSLNGDTYKMLGYFREVQTLGTAALVNPGTRLLYGFVVDKSDGTVKSYKIDNPSSKTNQYYVTSAALDPEAKVLTLKKTFEIESIEGILYNATTSLDRAYAFFKRPNPEARLLGMVGSNISPDTDQTNFDKIIITVRSKLNNQFKKKIVILQIGEMYVNDW